MNLRLQGLQFRSALDQLFFVNQLDQLVHMFDHLVVRVIQFVDLDRRRNPRRRLQTAQPGAAHRFDQLEHRPGDDRGHRKGQHDKQQRTEPRRHQNSRPQYGNPLRYGADGRQNQKDPPRYFGRLLHQHVFFLADRDDRLFRLHQRLDRPRIKGRGAAGDETVIRSHDQHRLTAAIAA
ncbi:hypothetical protein D1872_251180 [compost metagenome]